MIVAPKSKFLKQRQGDAPTIVQILPAMVRGGVERGTVEMADAVQKHGGRAIVVSRGGPIVRHLDRLGATHYQLDIHTKNPFRWPQVRRQLKAILSREYAQDQHFHGLELLLTGA